MGEPLFVVGPEEAKDKSIFLCPECDQDRLESVPANTAVQCTAKWLEGRQLACAARFGTRSCLCWQTDPDGGRTGGQPKRRRR
ncbi:hypothetical protein AB1Y20_003490 [Prymnesium parvum]|uniref:Uncharacterized protein n=1 Tax=Prymnesium parvum TaxID=97485 RepID=A0AB34JC57_PRYPA